jgi:hypothetical protein
MPVDDGFQAHHELKKFLARLKESEMNFKPSQTSLKDEIVRELALEEQVAALKGWLSQVYSRKRPNATSSRDLFPRSTPRLLSLRELVSRSENMRARARAPSALPVANLQKGRHDADQTSPC